MIKKIGLKNYKAFRDYNEFEIRPLTVFVGPNSAGKSSLIKLIGKIKLASSYSKYDKYEIEKIYDNRNTFCLNNDPIDIRIEIDSIIGDFRFSDGHIDVKIKNKNNILSDQEVVDNIHSEVFMSIHDGYYNIVTWKTIRQDTLDFIEKNYSKEIEQLFSYTNTASFGVDPLAYFLDLILSWIFAGDFDENRYLSFSGNIFSIEVDEDSGVCEGLGYTNLNAAAKNLRNNYDEYSLFFDKNIRFSEYIDKFRKAIFKNKVKQTKDIFASIIKVFLNNRDFNNEIKKSFVKIILNYLCADTVEVICSNYLSEFSDKIKATGFNDIKKNFGQITSSQPLRAFPQNYYTEQDFRSHFNLQDYDNSFDSDYNEIIGKVNDTLKLLEYGYSIVFKKIVNENLVEDLFVVRIKDNTTGIEYSFGDVGFGLSQIIPIIFSIIVHNNLVKDSILLIEQPEIHLHPKQQVNISKLFYDYVYSNSNIFEQLDFNIVDVVDNRIKTNNYFVIETHSEHLVRGFQVLVAEGKLKPNQIGIYYIDRNSDGASTIKNMELNEYGLFKEEFPKGFFDNNYNLTKKLLLGRLK